MGWPATITWPAVALEPAVDEVLEPEELLSLLSLPHAATRSPRARSTPSRRTVRFDTRAP
jgi:hypothetical protein